MTDAPQLLLLQTQEKPARKLTATDMIFHVMGRGGRYTLWSLQLRIQQVYGRLVAQTSLSARLREMNREDSDYPEYVMHKQQVNRGTFEYWLVRR